MFNGHSYSLCLDLSEPFRRTFRPFWHQRAMGLFNRLFRYPEFTVTTLGTGLNARQIGELITPFKPQETASK